MTGRKFSDSAVILHDLKATAKKALPVLLILLGVNLLLIPFSTAAVSDRSIFNINYTHLQLKYRFFLAELTPAVLGSAIFSGVVTALLLFRFLHDKRETTVYFALGIKRVHLLFNRIAVGLVSVFLAVLLPMTASVALNAKALGLYDGEAARCAYITAGLTVCAAVSFLITVCACLMAGTRAEAVVSAAGLILAPTALLFGLQLLFTRLFYGNPFGAVSYTSAEPVRDGLVSVFASVSPIGFFYSELAQKNSFYRPLSTAAVPALAPDALIAWAAILPVLMLAAFFLMKTRRNENASISGADKIMPKILVFECAFVTFCGVFAFLYPAGKVYAWCFSILGAALVGVMLRKGVYHYKSGGIRAFAGLAVGTALPAAAALAVMLASQAYAEHYAESGGISSVSISAAGDPNLIFTASTGTSTGRTYYYTADYTFTDPAEIELVQAVHAQIISDGAAPVLENTDRFADSTVPYDIKLTYTAADGKTACFYYSTAKISTLEALLALEDTQSVKSARETLLNGTLRTGDPSHIRALQAYQNGGVYLTDGLYQNTYKLDLDSAQRAQLLTAIAKDETALPAQTRYFPTRRAEAVLLFTFDAEYDLAHFGYRLNNAVLTLTADDANTMAYLREQGLLALLETDTEVESITFRPFEPFTKVKKFDAPLSFFFLSYCDDSPEGFLTEREFGNDTVITKPERIAAILPNLRNAYFMGGGGYLAAVKLKNVTGYVYLFLPEALAD
ncbi:MAG: hypothetical protein QM689_11485 [Oscillospiraceae bacterium]